MKRWLLNHKKDWSFWSAAIVFLTIIFLGLGLTGPLSYSDGWKSPSIGRQGACSWHGGVNTTPRTIVVFASYGAGYGVYRLVEKKINKT